MAIYPQARNLYNWYGGYFIWYLGDCHTYKTFLGDGAGINFRWHYDPQCQNIQRYYLPHYKPAANCEWHGFAKYLGQGGQNFLIKHGSFYNPTAFICEYQEPHFTKMITANLENKVIYEMQGFIQAILMSGIRQKNPKDPQSSYWVLKLNLHKILFWSISKEIGFELPFKTNHLAMFFSILSY